MPDSLTPKQLIQLEQLLRDLVAIPDAAAAMGFPPNSRLIKETAKTIRAKLGMKPGPLRHEAKEEPAPVIRAHDLKEELKITEQGDTKTYNSYSFGIKTLEDLIRHCEIDTTIWEPKEPTFNTWEMPKPDSETGKIALFQVKCTFRYIAAAADMKRLKEEILEEFRAAAPYVRRTYANHLGHLGVIHIPDVHIGKVPVPWLNEEWGITGSVETFADAIDSNLDRLSRAYTIERLVFILGSDFLHADNLAGGTTKGTPVQPSHDYQTLLKVGRQAAINAILACLEVAPVDVITIPGNHDFQTSLNLGEIVDARFHNEKFVEVDNTAYARKYYAWGNNLFGFTHGEKVKPQALPGKMASEVRELWARCEHREFQIGHTHTKELINVQAIKEIEGTLIRRSSSLAPLDFYHDREGYIGNARAAEIFAYDFEDGLAGSARYVVKGNHGG